MSTTDSRQASVPYVKPEIETLGAAQLVESFGPVSAGSALQIGEGGRRR